MQIVLRKMSYLLLTLTLFSRPAAFFSATSPQHFELEKTFAQIKHNAADHYRQKQLQYFLIYGQCDCNIRVTTFIHFLSAITLVSYTKMLIPI